MGTTIEWSESVLREYNNGLNRNLCLLRFVYCIKNIILTQLLAWPLQMFALQLLRAGKMIDWFESDLKECNDSKLIGRNDWIIGKWTQSEQQ